MFRVTHPYLNLPVKSRFLSCFLEKLIQCVLKYILPRFYCVHTQPNIFRPGTPNTLIFSFGLSRRLVTLVSISYYSPICQARYLRLYTSWLSTHHHNSGLATTLLFCIHLPGK